MIAEVLLAAPLSASMRRADWWVGACCSCRRVEEDTLAAATSARAVRSSRRPLSPVSSTQEPLTTLAASAGSKYTVWEMPFNTTTVALMATVERGTER